MTTKEQQKKLKAVDFVKSLEFEIDITWRDASGTHKIDEQRHVSLAIVTRGTSEHYVGMTARILHKQNGELEKKYFSFDNFLDRNARSDNRETDHPLNTTCRCFQVISHVGWYWYIAVPETTRPFCEVVEGWIEEWR
jgi:hypothetical protein